MLNIATILDYSTKEHPDKTSIVFGQARMTFGQANTLVNQVANGLVAAKIRKGDKVALSCPNLPFFPIVYYAILKAGAARKKDVINSFGSAKRYRYL